MRVGAVQVRGGMITRRPWCLLPRMEPPRASTMKLTRKLRVKDTMVKLKGARDHLIILKLYVIMIRIHLV